MKYLGVDFGEKRIGIAISDETGKLAFPHSIIFNDEKLVEKIEKIIKKEGIKEIIIGESKNFKGKPNKIMIKIEKFKGELEERTKLPIFFEPEFMTSVQAERIQGKNKMQDASAAAIILQYFIDKKYSML
jgi:putative Holliday junction resolvase